MSAPQASDAGLSFSQNSSWQTSSALRIARSTALAAAERHASSAAAFARAHPKSRMRCSSSVRGGLVDVIMLLERLQLVFGRDWSLSPGPAERGTRQAGGVAPTLCFAETY